MQFGGYFKWANPGLFLCYFRHFHITSQFWIEKSEAEMVWLGFEPGPQDGRRRRIRWAMAAAYAIWFYNYLYNIEYCK